jgi:hypothetical protein
MRSTTPSHLLPSDVKFLWCQLDSPLVESFRLGKMLLVHQITTNKKQFSLFEYLVVIQCLTDRLKLYWPCNIDTWCWIITKDWIPENGQQMLGHLNEVQFLSQSKKIFRTYIAGWCVKHFTEMNLPWLLEHVPSASSFEGNKLEVKHSN